MKLQHFALKALRTQIQLLSYFSKKKAGNKAFDIFCTPYGKRQYEPDAFYQSAEQLYHSFEGLKTAGYRWNKGGSKKIFIAHGFKSCSAKFGHFVKKLIVKGYEVLAFDAPAHGRSEGKKLTGILYKKFIQSLYETYGPFDGFVGHSFGGMAISFFVAELAENKNIKIALVAPASDTESLLQMFFNQMKIKDAEVQNQFIKKIEILGKHPVEWFSIKRCMPNIQSSVLWVHDRFDKITPVEDALALQKMNFSNVQFMFTKGLGHRRIYHDKNVVKAIVEFL